MNKRLKRCLLIVGVISLEILMNGKVGAYDLIFSGIQAQNLIDRFTDVHFVAPGNSFGGAVFWLPTSDLGGFAHIHLGAQTRDCRKQVAGLYYNSQRGERIWPLDPGSLSFLQSLDPQYDDLSVAGGLFTTCSGSVYSIVGQITYNRSGTVTRLSAGTPYVFVSNTRNPTSFRGSLEYFNNKLPLGYLFDSVGGIGFVGGIMEVSGHQDVLTRINAGDSVNTVFFTSGNVVYWSGLLAVYPVLRDTLGSALTTLWNLGVIGNVGLSQSISTENRQSILGNLRQLSAVFSAPSINNATILNEAQKNATQLCRWRDQTQLISDTLLSSFSDSLVCISQTDYDPTYSLVINLADSSSYASKTIILQNTNVILQNSANGSASLDLYVNRGNVLLDNTSALTSFGTNGFPASWSSAVTSGMRVVGSLLVNGLLMGYSGWSITGFTHKLYHYGKLISLNAPYDPESWRLTQIHTLFGWTTYDNLVSLQRTFARECNPVSGLGTDGALCGNAQDKFAFTPVVIIDQAVQSRLVK